MARVSKNSILSALQGQVGKELIFKQYADKTVVSKYPDMKRVKPSELQKKQRATIPDAVAYAQAVKRNPELREAIEKVLQPGESVYHRAIKQYYEKLKQNQEHKG